MQKNFENFEKSNEKRNFQRNNEERILEEHALEPKKVIFIGCLQSFFQKCVFLTFSKKFGLIRQKLRPFSPMNGEF